MLLTRPSRWVSTVYGSPVMACVHTTPCTYAWHTSVGVRPKVGRFCLSTPTHPHPAFPVGRRGGMTVGATSRASPLAASAKRGARARLRPFPRPPLCPLPWGAPWEGRCRGGGTLRDTVGRSGGWREPGGPSHCGGAPTLGPRCSPGLPDGWALCVAHLSCRARMHATTPCVVRRGSAQGGGTVV